MKLRSHQEALLKKAREAITRGCKRPLLVLPTGGGKTYLAREAVRGHVERGGKVIWTTHRDELVAQAKETLGDIPATVETIQTLLARGHRPDATMIVLDEAHHFVSARWSEFPKAYPNAIIVGLTATPERADGVGMGEVFDALCVGVSIKELTNDGVLVPCRIETTSRPLASNQIALRPVDAYAKHAAGRRAVCFSGSVQAAYAHAQEFRDAEYRAEVVTGEMSERSRREIVAKFKAGEIDCLVNVFVLTEGFDCPATDCIILARRCMTAGTYLQIVGRGLRAAAGKKDCLLLDLTGMVYIHGTPDEDRIYSLDGVGIRRATEVGERYCQVCGVLLEPTESVCPDCGNEPEPIEPPKVVKEKLQRFVYRPRASDAEKVEKLRKWIQAQRANGYKPNWPMVRFSVEFGVWPSVAMLREARK